MSEEKNTPYRVLARKYRPSTFAELIGQGAMVRTLTNAISADRLPHAFILTGVRGVGKTSTSVNLSIALADIGYNVGIIDVDLHGPDVPRMLGLEGTPQVNKNNKLDPISYSKTLRAIASPSY